MLAGSIGVLVFVACRPARPLFVEDGVGHYYFQDKRTGQTIGGHYTGLYSQLSDSKPQPLPRRVLIEAWDSTQRGLPWLLNAWGERTVRAFFFDNGPDYVAQGLMRYTNDSAQVGFANRRGRVKIPAQFTIAHPFQHGYSIVGQGSHQEPLYPGDTEHMVWRGGKWGIINRRGRVVAPLQYDELSPVRENTKWLEAVNGTDVFLINRKGRRLSARSYTRYGQRPDTTQTYPFPPDSKSEW
ncbi:WG repeat-containing protein [Hymenobacter aerophilus]|uniref:WG repeat-containing protein n=1 Tax=Hymenobacter aerophilus TaxID=119644 RepID=UPI001F0B501F|nr:WG repeat-containing protein [Hymenobacter aerophilus]